MKHFLLVLVLLPGFLLAQHARNTLRTQFAPFYHGVASGDPLHDRVIIWTRITPEEVNDLPVQGSWRMASDETMTQIVNSGTFTTSQNKDYTVKIDVTGLTAGTCYYFDFEHNGSHSAVGRTRTADLGNNSNARFAVVSCSNYQHGYFNAYRAISERNDINAVLHLGDYIYEYGAGAYSANITDRVHEPTNEIVSLDDYRLRYSHYRLDTDLQELHRHYPFICVWDDHESANDAYTEGADNHDPATQGAWADRKSNSIQAYFEWLPIRETSFENSIYRKIEYGNLLNLYMLDTRLEGRVAQVGATSGSLNDPNRTLLGLEQKNWLKNELLNSTAQWNILGQQVMMAPLLAFGIPVNTDQWDGYQAERAELLNFFVDSNIQNVVVLTGDIHTSWAMDLPLSGYNASTGVNSAAVEFVTTSVTSPGFPIGVGVSLIQSFNAHIKYVDLTKKGYIVLDINQQRAQAEWYHMADITTPNNVQNFANAYYVNHQERFVRSSSAQSTSTTLCPLAPTAEIDELASETFTLFGIYPNPFDEFFILHFGSLVPQNIRVDIIDATGKIIFTQSNITINDGSAYFKIYANDLSAGSYLVQISSNDGVKRHWVVKG